MSLYEKRYKIAKPADFAAQADAFKEFFMTELADTHAFTFEDDTENGRYVFWADETKSCGIGVSKTDNKIYFYDGRGATVSSSAGSSTAASAYYISYQSSINKDVIYIRISNSSYTAVDSYTPNFIFAKDDDGKWSVIYKDSLFNALGTISVACNAHESYNTPFTAVKMPSLLNGKMFASLYKILTATSFDISDTVAAFDGKPYRVVAVSYSSTCYPAFCFPVADEEG